MVGVVPVIVSVIFLVGVLFVVSTLSTPATPTSLQKVYNDIAFPSGDHIQFYQQAQQYVTAGAAQLSTVPSIPYKLMGIDSHNNVIAQDTTTKQIINATAGSTQAAQIITATTTPTTPTQQTPSQSTYVTTTGINYGAGSTLTSPNKTPTCTRGNTCTVSGKIIIVNEASCGKQSGCTNLAGPFRYTIQVLCVDSDPYRCNFLKGVLPTEKGETQSDGTFSFDWTPASDNYYVGNYVARIYAETESPTLNGPTVSESGDYNFIVY